MGVGTLDAAQRASLWVVGCVGGGGRGAATPISIKVVFLVVHRVASPQSRASHSQPWKVSMRSTLTC